VSGTHYAASLFLKQHYNNTACNWRPVHAPSRLIITAFGLLHKRHYQHQLEVQQAQKSQTSISQAFSQYTK